MWFIMFLLNLLQRPYNVYFWNGFWEYCIEWEAERSYSTSEYSDCKDSYCHICGWRDMDVEDSFRDKCGYIWIHDNPKFGTNWIDYEFDPYKDLYDKDYMTAWQQLNDLTDEPEYTVKARKSRVCIGMRVKHEGKPVGYERFRGRDGSNASKHYNIYGRRNWKYNRDHQYRIISK